MIKKIWDTLGDIRISFVLLMAASATLFVGSIYANANFSLFRSLNRFKVQDWLALHLKAQPELAWWIPLLFILMGALGLNTFICAANRVARLIPQRRAFSLGSFFTLLIPSIIHFLFIIIMIGHLTTFLSAKWQTIPLETGSRVVLGENTPPLEVQTLEDIYFPETSGLRHRISQTTVTFADAFGKNITLQYLHPVRIDGRFFFLEKEKESENKDKKEILTPEEEENCNKSPDFIKKSKSEQFLLIVFDPGFYIIISGLTLILCLMTWYFWVHKKNGGSTCSENR